MTPLRSGLDLFICVSANQRVEIGVLLVWGGFEALAGSCRASGIFCFDKPLED